MTARPATTYRAARRNAVLRPSPPGKPGLWPGFPARVRPIVNPSRTYQRNGERECLRRSGELARRKAFAQAAEAAE